MFENGGRLHGRTEKFPPLINRDFELTLSFSLLVRYPLTDFSCLLPFEREIDLTPYPDAIGNC